MLPFLEEVTPRDQSTKQPGGQSTEDALSMVINCVNDLKLTAKYILEYLVAYLGK